MLSRFQKWRRRLVVVFSFLALYFGGSTIWALLSFWQSQNKYPVLSYPEPDFTPVVEWSESRPKNWVSFGALPGEAWAAIVAAEDGGFFKHNGVEWAQSWKKVRADLGKGRFPGGISTLNQQIAKNLYFSARPAVFRKFQEWIVARKMDATFDKNRIMEWYLNIAEWGPGVVGIGQAAKYYFKKPASRLTAYECAVLANLLPNPRVRGAWLKRGAMPYRFARKVRRTQRQLPYVVRALRKQRIVAARLNRMQTKAR